MYIFKYQFIFLVNNVDKVVNDKYYRKYDTGTGLTSIEN